MSVGTVLTVTRESARDNFFGSHYSLTQREAEVLTLVANGMTNAEIGIVLGNSPRTVQKHLEHIFVKLGVETRTAAAIRLLSPSSSHGLR